MEKIINSINELSMELMGEQFTGKEIIKGIAKGAIALYALWACVYFLQNILPTLVG